MPYDVYPFLGGHYNEKTHQMGPCYYWTLRWRNFTDYPYIEDWLKQYRKEAVKDQEHWLAVQKEFKTDRDFAKFCKEESRYYLRLQRACTLMLVYFGEGEYTPSTEWPKELAPELDEIVHRIELREVDEKK